MGAVYRAYQASLERAVAVKVLTSELAKEPGYIERFYREAKTAAALEHAHIVPVYDYGVQREVSYVVMRLLTGGTLSERVVQRATTDHPLPSLGEVADLLNQLASALDYAHSQGVIHRDIKPSNVMFDNQGSAYIVDFGIAKLLEATSSFTASGVAMGTPIFMPPEQWRAEPLTPAADQYALGVMTYLLVAGRLPFEAPTPYSLMHKHLNETPTPVHTLRSGVPEALALVLDRALAKSPGDRFPTVTAFAQAFEGAISGQTSGKTGFFTASLPRKKSSDAPPVLGGTLVSGPQAARPASRGLPRWIWGAVAAALIVVVVALLVLSGGGGKQDDKTAAQPSPTETLSPTRAVEEVPTLAGLAALSSSTPPPAPTAAQFAATSPPVPTDSQAEVQLTTQADMATLQGQVTQAVIAGMTATVAAWTDTPTPDTRATAAAYLTATATLWTLTPTFTPSPVPTLHPANANQVQQVALWNDSMHSGVNSLALSPDGAILAAGNADNTIELWNMASGTVLRTLEGHTGSIGSVAFSPDSTWLASGSTDRTVRVWDLATGEARAVLDTGAQGFMGSSVVVAFSPGGTLLASGSSAGVLELWNPATGESIRSWEIPDSGNCTSAGVAVLSVVFSPDGQTLVSGSDMGGIHWWEVATGRLLRESIAASGCDTHLAFSPDGTLLASGTHSSTYGKM